MALYNAELARVTPLLEEVTRLCSLKSDDTKLPEGESTCKPSSVVEHLVFFNMPYLQGDQEAAILHALYDIQFKFENIQVLIVGRKLNMGVKNVTHALFMRFPTVEILQAYYKSNVLSNVAAIMLPHLHGEIVMDYVTAISYPGTSKKAPICASATLLRRKRDVRSDQMDGALHTLVAANDDTSYFNEFTAGSNLFLKGDKFYTHGCTSYGDTVTNLKKLTEDSQYTKVLIEEVLPLSSSTLTVKIMAFKPIHSAL